MEPTLDAITDAMLYEDGELSKSTLRRFMSEYPRYAKDLFEWWKDMKTSDWYMEQRIKGLA